MFNFMKGANTEKPHSSDGDSEWIEIEHSVESKEAEEESKKSDGETLTLSTNIAIDRYSFNKQHETSACVQIKAKDIDFEEIERKPIDLVVVLDKSGSMSGEKLTMCKETIKFLLAQLESKDNFALVTFDTYVEAFSFEKMTEEGKHKMIQIVDHVTPGSATNLSGGLFEGIKILMDLKVQKNANEIQSILLLTDGMANNGLCHTNELIHELQAQISDLPALSIFTFGYGENHNDEMLRSISDQGSGMYYFIEDEESISGAFGSCLGGLLSVLAQNISINIQTDGSIQIAKICTKNKVEVLEEGKHHSTVIGDIFAGENKDIVLKLSLQPVETPCVESIACRLEYFDVLSETNKSVQTELEVVRSDTDEGVVFNLQVVSATNRIIAAESIDEAMKVAKESHLTMGRHRLSRLDRRYNPIKQSSRRNVGLLNQFSGILGQTVNNNIQNAPSAPPAASLPSNIQLSGSMGLPPPVPAAASTNPRPPVNTQDPLTRARNVLQSGIDQITSTYPILKDSEYLEQAQNLVEDLNQCKASLRSREVYASSGSKNLSRNAQCHWKQRHNMSKSSAARANQYQNLSSLRMQSTCETFVNSKTK